LISPEKHAIIYISTQKGEYKWKSISIPTTRHSQKQYVQCLKDYTGVGVSCSRNAEKTAYKRDGMRGKMMGAAYD
jgi:hypothetical protein